MNRDEQPSLRGESRLQNAERSAILPGLSASHNSPYWQARPQPSAPSPQPSIEVHIEELLLHGFAPGDRYGIGAAVERELTRLFAEHGVLSSLTQDGAIVRLDGRRFQVAPDAKAETIGAQIAQAVYGGMGR
jgi:hypothetical protein